MRKSGYYFAILAAAMVVISSSKAQNMKFGGYIQTWYLDQQTAAVGGHAGIDSSVSGFRIRRARLNAKAEMSDVFSIDSWYEFAGSTNILLDFKATAKVAPEFAVSAGQFIPPVSMNETANQPSSKLPLYELSDVAINLANIMGTDSYRDVGMMVGGTFAIANAGNLKYGAYYGNGRGRFSSVNQTFLNRKFGQGLYGLRLDYEPVKGLMIGGHFSTNKQDSLVTGTTTSTSTTYAYIRDTSGAIKKVPVTTTTTSAVSITNLDRNSFSFDVVVDGLAALPALFADFEYGNGKVNDGTPYKFNGFFGIVGYKVIPEVQLLARYDAYTLTPNTITTASVETKAMNWTFGANYLFVKDNNELAKVGLNYEIRKEDPVDARNNAFVLWAQFRMF